ncbi:MAG: molecular chaperone TorD family protein [Planctomycetota bacterium]
MHTPLDNSEGNVARARGAGYGFIGHGFRYPDRAMLCTLTDAHCWSGWPALLGAVDAEVGRRIDDLRTELTHIANAVGNSDRRRLDELHDAYAALFGHTVRGQCPAYELEYGQGEIIQRASDLADISGFYAAFGLAVVQSFGDRPDHVTVECEFMSTLCTKEAHAIESDDTEQVETVRRAQRLFLRDHLGRWLPAFADRAANADSSFYSRLARFAAVFIRLESRRLDVPVGPTRLELRPVDAEQETTINCGGADMCPPGGAPPLTQVTVSAGS